MKPIETFSGDRIYIDASIFLCYLLGVDDPSLERKTKGFLERLKEKKFEGIVSPLVVDEIIFNYIGGLMKSREGVNISDVVREAPEKVKRYYSDAKEVVSWLESFSKLRFIPISEKVSWTFVNEMKHGIFPRDAIHVATMREVGIKEIATYDDDFDRVPNIIRWG